MFPTLLQQPNSLLAARDPLSPCPLEETPMRAAMEKVPTSSPSAAPASVRHASASRAAPAAAVASLKMLQTLQVQLRSRRPGLYPRARGNT